MTSAGDVRALCEMMAEFLKLLASVPMISPCVG